VKEVVTMFRGVNVAHKYVNAEVRAALPRFLAPRWPMLTFSVR